MIRAVSSLAPLHNPHNLAGIEVVRVVRPDLPQVAVFDTAFHQTMPSAAFRYAVPEEWYARYGSTPPRLPRHQPPLRQRTGRRPAGPSAGPVAAGHRASGSGPSLAAVRDGLSVDTTNSG